jgi:hypothetical protein
MSKTLHFLSGLPRSGSTVLAAILNQNPVTHVSTTSGLVFALDSLANIWGRDKLLGENDPKRKRLAQTMRGVINSFYEDTEENIIIDKARTWPLTHIMGAMNQVLNRKPRIIATVRSIPDCAASFVRIAKPEDMDAFMYSGQLIQHLKGSYASLQSGYAYDPECFLFVEYEDLIEQPQKELERIHKFLDLDAFEYDFNKIDSSTVQENDEELHGIAGLHDIKPKLEKQHNENSKDVLGQHYSEFCQSEFWLDEPRTKPIVRDLDLQLAAATLGDFKEAWRLAEKIRKEEPNNLRAKYNRGWYLLRQGKIQDGYALMDRGRIAGVFGNSPPDVPTPKWDGKAKGTVLLNLEGGLGDEIHQIRYAKDIAARGCKVVVACSGYLVPLFADVEGVSAVVQHNAAFGVYHDYWVAGMSAVVPLGFELPDISGKPYLNKLDIPKHSKKRIGLRWQGGTKFEHEHHKKFPYELMFEAVKDTDAEFISLQRDEGVEAKPKWVKEVLLDTWKDTQKAVASCDLVISACTSVSHIAAAMGVDTWVVTPVLPYFLYAQDGESTPYYDSMKLFRQKEFGKWEAPFDLIKERLSA